MTAGRAARDVGGPAMNVRRRENAGSPSEPDDGLFTPAAPPATRC
jgi:hypothetical protein